MDDAAPGYRFPRRFVLRWACFALIGSRRNLRRDSLELIRAQKPLVSGREHLPADGRFVLIMNHYERPGLAVWWPALAVSASYEHADLRWIITNRFYRYRLFGRLPVPERLVGWVLGRVARVYGLVSIERRREGIGRRAVALRRMRRSLDATPPVPIASTPEAEYGGGRALRAPYPSAGKALAWLSRGTVPLVPVGIGEEDGGRLVIRIGEPFVLEWPGMPEARRQREALAHRIMESLAGVLPPEQRGGWSAPGEGER